MHNRPIDRPTANARSIDDAYGVRRDWIAAIALGLLLSLCWTMMDWPQIGQLNLPDTDDMMRLAQVRDWIAGQAFNDWTQYRLAPPFGAPMHWSRINDIGPALIILLLDPVVGRYGAELAAVIAYPAMLFTAYLFCSARMARRLGGTSGALVAIVLAAIAYPANSLFLPGRIDHHALQIVLMQVAILTLIRPGGWKSGAILGGAIALSFGIGLETALHAGALMGVLFLAWVLHGDRERDRMLATGAALAGVTLALFVFARPTYWTTIWCDAFTPASVAAALAGSIFWIVAALATPRLPGIRLKLAAGAVLGAIAAAALVARFPNCLAGPYGAMDPFVARALIGNILEAQGLFEQRSLGSALQVAGLLIVATIAAAWIAWRRPEDRWALLPIAAVLAVCDLLVLSQVRGAYLGSAIAAPVLAQLILAARALPRWRTPALVAAWLGSAGMVWLLLPERIERAFEPRTHAAFLLHKSCWQGDVWRQIDRYPAGIVIAAPNQSARIIGGTRHASIGAGYHRSNRGNRAMYAFFLSTPDTARRIGGAWRADYVAFCPTDLAELNLPEDYPGSLAFQLAADRPPPWLRRLPLRDTGIRLYRVVEPAR